MTDSTIDEVRRVRRMISAEMGPGLDGLVDRYAKMESRFSHAPLTHKDRRTIRCNGAAKSGELAVKNHSSPPADRQR